MSIKYRLHENTILLSSIAHGLFTFTTSKTVTDLHLAECEIRQRKIFQRPDDAPDFLSKKLPGYSKKISR